MAKLIKINAEITDVQPADKAKGFTLEELYELIGNGCNLVEVVHLKGNCIMVVDEEGAFKEDAEINISASVMYNINQGVKDRIATPIFGNILLCNDREIK